MGITQKLSHIIAATRYENLGAECVDRVKQAIKDGIAVAIAGSDQASVRIGAAHVKSFGARPFSTIWAYGFKSSPMFAAYVNGMATHVLDYEPMWSPPTHSISPTVPAAIALAEWCGINGKQIVTAVAKGMEIQGRMQYAGNRYVPEKLKFHPPGFAGVIGASVTSAHLLGLDENQLRYAMGIAGSRTGGLIANIGTMTKSAHCGQASSAGLDSALLAKRGFTSNPDVFEALKGLIDTFYPDEFDAKKLLQYGKPWRMVDPGLAIKLYPSQYGTQFSVTAGLELAPRIADKSKIASITITGPVMSDVDRPSPVSGLAGKHSFQYTTAAAILDGAVGIDTFTDRRRFKPDMVALLKKITLRQDKAIPNDLHKMRIEIDVNTKDGRHYRAVCHGPKGTWGMPRLTAADHRVKLDECFRRKLSDKATSRLLELLDSLERQNSAGIQEIVRLLAGPKTQTGSRRSSHQKKK